MSLTRADLESNQIQQAIAQSERRPSTLSEAELQASIRDTLQQGTANTDVWIFAYGSLIWNPIIQFAERRVGTVHGFHRRFCLWTPYGRGTPENRGLVLGLDRGGSCRGIVYRLASTDVETELPLLWRREMMMGCYRPRWVKVIDGEDSWQAIAFVVNHQHRAYAGDIAPEVMVKHIATASGTLGSCADYLLQTLEGLNDAGIKDKSLLRLKKQVLAQQQLAQAET
jgi:glutathione-specific gamma-glutamylcyclotransferase